MQLISFPCISGFVLRPRQHHDIQKGNYGPHSCPRDHLHADGDVQLHHLLPPPDQPQHEHRSAHPQPVGDQAPQRDQRHHHARALRLLAPGRLVLDPGGDLGHRVRDGPGEGGLGSVQGLRLCLDSSLADPDIFHHEERGVS